MATSIGTALTTAQSWGRLIRDIRVEKGLSQHEVIRKTGLNRNTYRSIEEGNGFMRLEFIERVLYVLGYELDLVLVSESIRELPEEDEA